MRTTVDIHEDLLARAKQLALERNCTLGEIIDDALRQRFSHPRGTPARRSTRVPTFRGRGLQPGVDLDSGVALIDLMEDR